MTDSDIFAHLERLAVWRRHGERAPLSTPVWSWTFPPVSRLTLWVGLHVRTSKYFGLRFGALKVG
jgi:hypothetical protein